jgi:SpoVK/Ycf46/Vps4 family AAA+-type ATPase
MLSPPDTAHELETLIRSRIPLVVIETRDEAWALALLGSLATRLTRPVHTPVFQWTVTDGLSRIDVDLGGAQRHNIEPVEVLKSIRATDKAGVYVLLDFHPFLADPMHVRLIKDIALGYGRTPRTLVFLGHEVPLPRELEHFAGRFDLRFPSREERLQLVEKVVAEWSRAPGGSRVRTDRRALELLVENLAGLSTTDTERLVRKAVFDDGALSASDLPVLMQAKYDLLNRNGVLAFEYDTARFADVGGMARLKNWLEQRRGAFDGSAPGLDAPKGVLLLGVQGCGKSLAARAAAGVLGCPLLRLDFGALYNKYHGESERNLRESLGTADVMAPCVLWIDEIEKGLATSDSDGGTSRRVLGTFLTWLAEKRSRVFVVATANDIAALPPELVRKGRFDEIFFVDLPGQENREQILEIHASRRGLKLTEGQKRALGAAADGYSGAEIEQAVVSAAYTSHAVSEQLGAEHVLAELRATRPLSVVMAEKIEALRAWAADRTVAAD